MNDCAGYIVTKDRCLTVLITHMYHKKLFKVFAGLLLAIGITVIFLLPVFRADLDRNGLDRRTFAHMSAIIDAVYSGEYDVTLEK